MNSRDKRIDLMRFFGILFVVIGHSCTYNNFTKIIYLFHMALFFILSGYCYNDYYNKNMFKFVINKLKSLYIPYILSNIIYVLLHNVFIELCLYTYNYLFLLMKNGNEFGLSYNYSYKEMLLKIVKVLTFFGGEQMGGANWFLRILFITSISFCIVQTIIEKIDNTHCMIINTLIAGISLGLGYYLSRKNLLTFGNLSSAFSAYFCLYLGFTLKKIEKDIIINKTILMDLIVLISSVTILICLSFNNHIIIASNYLGNPVIFLIASISGYFLTSSMSDIIFKLEKNKLVHIISNTFIYIGRKSVWIMCIHFLSFKAISWLIMIRFNYPRYYLASFPIIYENSSFNWIYYTLAGICIPLILEKIYQSVLYILKENKEKRIERKNRIY